MPETSRTFTFTITMQGEHELTPALFDAMVDAGFVYDDASVSTCERILTITYDREAESLGKAIASAVLQLDGAGYRVDSIQVHDAPDAGPDPAGDAIGRYGPPIDPETGKLRPQSDEERRARSARLQRTLEEIATITDETDRDEVWDQVFRALGVERRSFDARGQALPMTDEEIRARNERAIRVLDSFQQGDAEEQRATLEALTKGLEEDPFRIR